MVKLKTLFENEARYLPIYLSVRHYLVKKKNMEES